MSGKIFACIMFSNNQSAKMDDISHAGSCPYNTIQRSQ